MSLSKQQMIGAVGGGVFVLGALGLGWLLYSAWDGKGEAEEQLTEQTEAYARFNNAPVYPSKASIDSVKSNATSYAQWYDSAMALAAQGDKLLPTETPPIFKQRLQGEVRRMLNLVGGVNGKIADPKFLFGFEQYLGEGGVLPKEEDVPRLAVQLDTIALLVDAFAEAGVHEVKSIVRVEEKSEKTSEGDEEKPSAKKSANKKGAAEEKGPKTSKYTYTFEVTAYPEAIVETLNKLTSCRRFAVVRNLSLKGVDLIVERLNAAEKAKAEEGQPKSAPRRRRGGAATPVAAENPALQAAVDRIVSDPEVDDPMTMSFTVDVYDFGRATVAAEVAKPAEAPAEAKADEKKADEAKPAEAKADEKKADEAKPAEAKADEKKPAEAKADEKKAEEKPATEKKEDK